MAPKGAKGKAARTASPAKIRPDSHKKKVSRQKAKAPAASLGASVDDQPPVKDTPAPVDEELLERMRANAAEQLALERAAAVAAAEAATAFRLSEEEEMAQAFAEFYSEKQGRDWTRPLDGRPTDQPAFITSSVAGAKFKKLPQEDLQASCDNFTQMFAMKKAQGEQLIQDCTSPPSPKGGRGKAARVRSDVRAPSPRTAAVLEASARIVAAKSAAKASAACGATGTSPVGPGVAELRVAVPASVAVSSAFGGSNQQNPERLPPPSALDEDSEGMSGDSSNQHVELLPI